MGRWQPLKALSGMVNAAGEGEGGKEGRTEEAGDEIHAGRKDGERKGKMRRWQRKRRWWRFREERKGGGRWSMLLPRGRLPYLAKLADHSPGD